MNVNTPLPARRLQCVARTSPVRAGQGTRLAYWPVLFCNEALILYSAGDWRSNGIGAGQCYAPRAVRYFHAQEGIARSPTGRKAGAIIHVGAYDTHKK